MRNHVAEVFKGKLLKEAFFFNVLIIEKSNWLNLNQRFFLKENKPKPNELFLKTVEFDLKPPVGLRAGGFPVPGERWGWSGPDPSSWRGRWPVAGCGASSPPAAFRLPSPEFQLGGDKRRGGVSLSLFLFFWFNLGNICLMVKRRQPHPTATPPLSIASPRPKSQTHQNPPSHGYIHFLLCV